MNFRHRKDTNDSSRRQKCECWGLACAFDPSAQPAPTPNPTPNPAPTPAPNP